MKNIKRIIGIMIIGITLCGCGSSTVTSEISVNNSEQEVTVFDSGKLYINKEALHSLVTYNDNTTLKEFTPTNAVYIFKTGASGYTYSGPLIGPNGYNCLYSDEGYIYESVTNDIVYDFR